MDQKKYPPVHICIILPLFYPFKSGGIEKLYTHLGRHFEEIGDAKISIVTRYLKTATDIVYPNNFDIYTVKTPSQTKIGRIFFLIYLSFIENIVFAWKASRIVSKLSSRFDVIISSDPITMNFLKRYSKDINRPIVLSSHGFLSDVIGLSQPLIKPVYHYLEKRAWILCDYAVFFGKIHAHRFSNTKVPHMVLNAVVDLDEFDPKKYEGDVLRRKHGLDGKFLVITIASLRRRVKGFEYLIPAIQEVSDGIPNIMFLSVGKGNVPYYEKIASHYKVNNYIHFFGMVPQNDVLELLRIADIFILPSLSEGIPQAIAEALAMEKPVIGTNVGGIPDILTHEKTGIIIPPRSSQAISQAIIELYKNPEKRKMLAIAGRKEIIDQCSVKAVAENFYSLLISLTKNH